LQSARRAGDHDMVSALLLGGEEVEAEKITGLLAERGSLQQTAMAANGLVGEALAALDPLDDNRFTSGLRGVAEYLQALIRKVSS
jgi:geranylgeranyl pyrophosphate synthase